MKNKPYFSACLLFGVIFLCARCKSGSKEYEPTYSADTTAKKILLFGVPNLPFYNLADLFVNYLNENLKGARVQAVPCSNLTEFDNKLQTRYFDFSVGSGVQAVQSAGNGYQIIAASVNAKGTGGFIFVNRDSLVNTFSDLRGKTIATVGLPALPGHMLQMLYLSKNGINVAKDIHLMNVESFESVYLNVYLGNCSAGFISVNGWENLTRDKPLIASKLLVKWEMPGIINAGILFRNDLPGDLSNQLKRLVLTMHQNDQGRKALAKLAFLRFEPADSNSYQPVKDFLKEYKVLVGNEKI